jgi:hypothetical protein
MSRKQKDANPAVAEQVLDVLGRRNMLRRSLALGAGGVAAAAALPLLASYPASGATATSAAPAASAARAAGRRTEVFDVAMLGDSLLIVPGPNIDNFDLRGTTFYVEGPVYPGFTIPNEQTDWDPAQHTDLEIGRYFDIGSFMLYRARLNPHLYSVMTHLFGLITPDDNFPPDQINSIGTEASATQDTKPSIRSIVGGTGRYVGATGQISLFGNGSNVTQSNVLGAVRPAPNLRFFFNFTEP